MENNFANQFKPMLDRAVSEMSSFPAKALRPEHLLLASLRPDGGAMAKILDQLQVSRSDIVLDIETHLRETESDDIGVATYLFNEYHIYLSAVRLLKLAASEARKMHSPVIMDAHLVLALMHDNRSLDSQFIKSMKEKYLNFDIQVSHLPFPGGDPVGNDGQEMSDAFSSNDEDPEEDRNEKDFFGKKRKESATNVLDKFSIDMTKAASEGKLDPVVGREVEIERLAQILARRKKNNPVLIGEPGVGKSAIVEGLASRIISRKVPRVLFNKRVLTLDMAGIVAGTKYRGQFEERIKAVIDELVKHPEIIVFIDEIHTIVGAGSTPGSMDAANLLKPALARGEIQCIGATTLDEYRTNIEKDGALERRFQKVMVEPTSKEETLEILKQVKGKYEQHHNVEYSPEALKACVDLTERYISDRNFPDKALDALDEAGSRAHITDVKVPDEISRMENQLSEISAAKIEARNKEEFERAASLRDDETRLKKDIADLTSKWEANLASTPTAVSDEDVATVVAMMTGVPVQRIAQAEGSRLLKMGDILKDAVIGQNEAIGKIVKAIQRNRIGLKDPNKPIGTFLFLGPTGVGKTYLAKKLAEFLFDSSDSLIRIDMSEYMEKFTVSRLVGAPPGYVGYEEGGQLTEKVRRRPYSIVLLDEIEKAHPDVFNLLLQVLDEGRLTDSLGRKIDFKNTILIMTSNVGSRQLKDFGAGVGFKSSEPSKEQSLGIITKALNKTFSPEFLNRIDDIVTFSQLSKDDIYDIIDIEMKDFIKRVESLGYTLILSDEAKNFIADKGYDVQYGARPLKRALQKYLEDELAEFLLNLQSQEIDSGEITASLNDKKDGLKLEIK